MSKTLLVADDSVVIQKLVGLSFANEEIELITTDNGDDAIAMAREHKPNLVLADVVMPGRSGYEVCQAIKQDPELAHTPVLLLTGTFEAFDEARAREVGADGHITKPFEAQILVERVNSLLTLQPEAAGQSASPPGEAAPVSSAEDDYDFFDQNAIDPATAEFAPASISDDELEFGDALDTAAGDLDSAAALAQPAGAFPGDQTLSVSPEDPILTGIDPLSAAPSLELEPPVAAAQASPDLTVLADFDLDSQPSTTPTPPTQATGDETLLADDFCFETAASSNASSPPAMLGDDLFGDALPAATDAPNPNAFDFDASGATPESPAPVAAIDSGAAAEPAFEPSSEPITAADPFQSPSTPQPAAQDDLLEIEPLGDGLGSELQVELEGNTEAEPAFAATLDEPAAPAQFEAEPEAATGGQAETAMPTSDVAPQGPDLTAMIRERLHETLEKVAWEAFADISDTIVRQVIQRVESIAWEVIPQMAETMIQEEIRRMKGEPGE